METGCHYEVIPRSEDLGGGWRLRLLEDGEEVGGGVFPAGDNGYAEALDTALDWLAARGYSA